MAPRATAHQDTDPRFAQVCAHVVDTGAQALRSELRAVCGVLPETCVRPLRPLLCSRLRGAARPPLPIVPSTASPAEEDVPRPRARRRPSTRLDAHPRGDAPRGQRLDVATVARRAAGAAVGGGHAGHRGAGREPRVDRVQLRAPARRLLDRGARLRHARADRRRRHRGTARQHPAGEGGWGRVILQPALHVRPVRHRGRQPARPCGRAGRRRDARPRLQPAVHLRAARARQDAPAALDRQLRQPLRRGAHGPLHHGRGVHRPLRRRAPHRRHRGVQGRLPRRRRAARG